MKEKKKEGMKNVSKLRPCKLKNGSSIQEEGLARPKHEVIYCHAYSFLVFFFSKKKLSYKEGVVINSRYILLDSSCADIYQV